MSDEHVSAVCPGARALLPNAGGTVYLRVSVFVVWRDAPPNTETFYLTGWPLQFTGEGLESLELQLYGVMADQWQTTRLMSATFVAYTAVELTGAEVAKYGWRVLTGPHA